MSEAEKVTCSECKGTGGVFQDGDCTDCNGKGYDWDVIEDASQSPAPIPEQVAQASAIDGLKKHTRSDGNFGLAEFYLVADVDRLLATQSAKQDAQPAEARGECEHCGTARPLHLLTCPVAEKGMAEGKKKEAAEPLRQLLIDLSNNTYFCGLHLADDAKYAAYLQEAEKAEQGIIELFGSIQASVEQAPVAQEVTQQAAKAETAAKAEQVQWSNIQKIVRDLADFCFGSADASGQISLGAAHVALSNSLTAKDGLCMRLDPLPQRAALAPLSEPRIVELYRESFKAMANRLREPPKYVSPCVLDFARAIESEVASRFRAQGGTTNTESSDLAPTTSTVSASGVDGSAA